MKFSVLIRHIGTPIKEAWVETFTKNIESPQCWAEDTIENFNASLRPNEKPREVLMIRIIDPEETVHEFEKTNLVTLYTEKDGYHDKVQCRICGATGKRHGLSDTVLDKKYREKKCKRKGY